MSSVGTPSVMQTMTGMPASFASRMASAAPGAGTKMRLQLAPVCVDGVAHGVEDGHAFRRLAAAAGRDAGDDLRPVLDAATRLEAALAARDALDEHAGVRIDQYAQLVSPLQL